MKVIHQLFICLLIIDDNACYSALQGVRLLTILIFGKAIEGSFKNGSGCAFKALVIQSQNTTYLRFVVTLLE